MTVFQFYSVPDWRFLFAQMFGFSFLAGSADLWVNVWLPFRFSAYPKYCSDSGGEALPNPSFAVSGNRSSWIAWHRCRPC